MQQPLVADVRASPSKSLLSWCLKGLDDVENFFSPTAPLSMETTPTAKIPRQSELNFGGFGSPDLIHSSLSSQENLKPNQAEYLLPRIYFQQIADFINGLISPVVSVITTTIFFTTTETATSSTTTTLTFFVSSCTPSPFPYSVCPARY